MVEEVIVPSRTIDEEIIVQQTGCSYERATIILRMFNYNIVDSMVYLNEIIEEGLER